MRAAVFDADGTLFDSMWVWERFASNFLESQGLLPDLQADIDTRYMCLAQSAKYFREKFKIHLTNSEIFQNILTFYIKNTIFYIILTT